MCYTWRMTMHAQSRKGHSGPCFAHLSPVEWQATWQSLCAQVYKDASGTHIRDAADAAAEGRTPGKRAKAA